MADVVLVSMPFANIFWPSMGLSLLKGALNRQGVSSAVRYFGIPFARRIGRDFYMAIAEDKRPSVRHLAGEWMFAQAAFDTTAEDDERYITHVLKCRTGWVTDDMPPLRPATIRGLVARRRHVDAFVNECVDDILAAEPRLVGFTSVFQQHVASLAVARRLKQRAPHVTVVFGGSNCEGVMGAETVRQFAFVDAAVSGEADLIFPDLVRRVLEGAPLSGLTGVTTRDTVHRAFQFGVFNAAPPVREMDALPYPDFDDFFAAFNATGFSRRWLPHIFFETSRGCWWGEKQHCTFCGLNGQTMEFRSKSAPRALEELLTLAERHPGCDMQVVDNILDMRYFNDLLPALAAQQPLVNLFYETKANLKKDQLRMLRAAGVLEIQPGVESFSDRVLELMRKGVTALQNIQLLKWCTELGIRPYWNVLWGFPGEPADDYRRMADLIPLLAHLAPPVGFGGIRLDRFSPNFFDAERLGFRNVQPLPSYELVYGLERRVVANLAYHFTFDYADGRRVDDYAAPLLHRMREWPRRGGESALFAADLSTTLVVCDTRPAARSVITVLSGLDRQMYVECDGVTDVRRLTEMARRAMGPAIDTEWVVRRLEPLCTAGLMVRDGSRYLSLAILIGEYAPAAPAVTRLYETLFALGRARKGDLLVRLTTEPGTSIRHPQPISGPRLSAGARRYQTGRLVAEQFHVGPEHLLVRFPVVPSTVRKGMRDGQEASK